MHTPAKALQAMAAPAPLTLGQVALLDLYKCPILDGDYSDLNATAFALWLLSMPLEQAVAEAHFPERAIVWADKEGTDAYNKRLVEALLAIGDFFEMLPKAEAADDDDDDDNGDGDMKVKDLKKKYAGAGTAISRRSPSSCAARTAGRFATFFRRFLPSRWRSSTAAGCRQPAG